MASIWIELLSSLLLFSLVFGMSATVEIAHIRKQVHNSAALLIGATLQFVILPFVGFCTVKLLQLPAEVGITLLVITSSPGGSYSNWWCSMFNADLALSVTMTALSTLLSTLMLPANLVLYTKFTYSAAVVQTLDWRALFISLTVVIGGIGAGLIASHRGNTTGNAVTMRRRANRMGNCAGLALILLSVSVSSSHQKAAIWDQDASFYAACSFPPILGLILAVSLASYCELEKPERVSVSIESCYQNTGIATTVALTMFQSEAELATAIGVPLLYGIVEGIVILFFCLICWKSGWTKAPANANLCTVIATSYEVESTLVKDQEPTAIEIVLSDHDIGDGHTRHMIFSQTDDGSFIVDEETLHEIELGHVKKQQQHVACVDAEDPTECSESDHVDDGCEEEANGVVSIAKRNVPLQRWRPYKSLVPTQSRADIATSISTVESDEMAPASDVELNPSEPERTTLSGIRGRASQYLAHGTRVKTKKLAGVHTYVRPPMTLVDENDAVDQHSQEEQSTTKVAVTKVATSSQSVVSKVAASVSQRRTATRLDYKSISTASSPSKDATEPPSINGEMTDVVFDDSLL